MPELPAVLGWPSIWKQTRVGDHITDPHSLLHINLSPPDKFNLASSTHSISTGFPHICIDMVSFKAAVAVLLLGCVLSASAAGLIGRQRLCVLFGFCSVSSCLPCPRTLRMPDVARRQHQATSDL